MNDQEETAYKELQAIQSKLNAPKDLYNKFGKYSYRSCESILSAVKPLLKEEGATITLNDEVVMLGDRFYVKATAKLTYRGASVSCSAFAREAQAKKGMDEAQITGSASSYARKYALNGLLAIDDTKDPDETNKHGKGAKQKTAADFSELIDKADSVEALEKIWKDNKQEIERMTKQEQDNLALYCKQIKEIFTKSQEK